VRPLMVTPVAPLTSTMSIEPVKVPGAWMVAVAPEAFWRMTKLLVIATCSVKVPLRLIVAGELELVDSGAALASAWPMVEYVPMVEPWKSRVAVLGRNRSSRASSRGRARLRLWLGLEALVRGERSWPNQARSISEVLSW